VHDRLPPNGCVRAHITVKFWEITGSIVKMVQDKHVVKMEGS